MTYQEAIETIKIAIAEVEWDYPMDYAIAFETAIEAIEKQTKWISVNDRLPDMKQLQSDWVIGVANGKYKGCTYEDSIQMVVYDKEINKWYLDGCFDEDVNVSYWMPLPELPKNI